MDRKIKITVRNYDAIPHLEREGKFERPLPTPHTWGGCKTIWHENMSPHERLFYHQTLASARSSRRYRQLVKIPKDSLEFRLQSCYNHSKERFAEKTDTVLQRDTCYSSAQLAPSKRLLRNVYTYEIKVEDPNQHPLIIAGIKAKLSPHSVKLINNGPHLSQLVNNGFSRQEADGNFFRY